MNRWVLKYFPYFLMVYHLMFAWLAYDYVNQNNGDAVKYWFIGKNLSKTQWSDFLYPGTIGFQLFTFPLVKYLKISPLLGCFLFSAWSGYGFYRLWNLLKPMLEKSIYLLMSGIVLLLLPNVHFWTSLIGKEALLFLPMVLIIEHIYKEKYGSISLILSVAILGWIRPHVAAMFLMAWIISVLIKSNFSFKKKINFSMISLGLGLGVYFLLMKATNATEGVLQKISRYYEVYRVSMKKTRAYVPLEDYTYPYKLFTFYFRPLPFEKNNFYYTMIGLEGLLLTFFFIMMMGLWVRYFKQMKWNTAFLFALLSLSFYASVFVYAYSNLGLIIRSRALVFPFIIFVFIWTLYQVLEKKMTFQTSRPH